MLYYVIDAFTENKFGGNPAGVVIHENLDEQFMLKFAAEVRFSETAFIKKINNKTFEIKFFTPTDEVDLCGHATIASFKALLDHHLVEENQTYFMKTAAGTLPVSINESFIMMEQDVPKLGMQFKDYNTLGKLFSIDPNQIGHKELNLIPQAASTGLWDLMLPIKTKEALYALNPDFDAIKNFTEAHDIGGIHAFTLDCGTAIAESRNFCPRFGINEESATGTSTGALTYYLFKNKIVHNFDQEYSFLQGFSMERPSTIVTKLVNPDIPTVMVGGNAVILTKGTIY